MEKALLLQFGIVATHGLGSRDVLHQVVQIHLKVRVQALRIERLGRGIGLRGIQTQLRLVVVGDVVLIRVGRCAGDLLIGGRGRPAANGRLRVDQTTRRAVATIVVGSLALRASSIRRRSILSRLSEAPA